MALSLDLYLSCFTMYWMEICPNYMKLYMSDLPSDLSLPVFCKETQWLAFKLNCFNDDFYKSNDTLQVVHCRTLKTQKSKFIIFTNF